MIVKDSDIVAQILKVADQYNMNIATRFLRPLLTGILAEDGLSRVISALTEQTDTAVTQGVHLDELYLQILSMARFIYLVRTNVLPNIRTLAGPPANDMNRIYRDMALNNFSANINVLADLVNDLYLKAVDYDKAKSPNGHFVYQDIPGFTEIGRYLVR